MILIPPVSERDHAQGPATAVITLVEYGDYHSQECVAAQPWIEVLQSQMGDRFRLVFRHFPADGLHPHAAEAAEVAGLQGQFWEMHAMLFEHQAALGNGHLVEYARDLGLDTTQFLQDMAGHDSVERVRSDMVSGAESGVQKTPAFFINGVRGPGSWEVGFASLTTASAQNIGEIGGWIDGSTPSSPDGDEERSSELSHVP